MSLDEQVLVLSVVNGELLPGSEGYKFIRKILFYKRKNPLYKENSKKLFLLYKGFQKKKKKIYFFPR